MDARNILLDKAVKACSPASQIALAARLEISAQQVSRWRHGDDPMPTDQIARIARIAHLDGGEWLLLIEAEQAKGEARKAYGSLIKRLGIAALLGIALVPVSGSAEPVGHFAVMHGLSIMSILDNWEFEGLVSRAQSACR